MVVDIPAPLGPMKLNSWPRSKVKELLKRLDAAPAPMEQDFDGANDTRIALGHAIRLAGSWSRI